MRTEIESDERVGTGGFLAIRRLRLRHHRGDGSTSSAFPCDYVVRPYGQDAVVVVAWHRAADGVHVLLRDGLRPAVWLGRDPAAAPLPEPPPRPQLTELVAGIVETSDRGEAGLRARAVAELREEAGLEADPARLVVLGAGTLPTPGTMAEKYYFVAAEVDPSTQRPPTGDGSPMEEGATTRWVPLADAIAACTSGEVCDAKTELGLRRLRDHLRP